MKRFILMIPALILSILLTLSTNSYAEQLSKDITVLVDGLPVNFDTQPIIRNGYTMVPFSAIAKALDISVQWDNPKQMVTAQKDSTSVRLIVGEKTAYCDNKAVKLDVSPVNLKGRVLIPLRFFSEAFNCKVQWDGAQNTVKIASTPKPMTVIGYYALGDTKTSSWKGLFGEDYPKTALGNTDIVSDVDLGWYSIDEQGNLVTKSKTGWQRPEGWEDVLDAARKYQLEPEMIVHATDKDSFIINLLNNQTAVDNAVSLIAQEAQKYKGVDLDFEGLGLHENDTQLTATRNAFNRFVEKLYLELNKDNINLTLSLHALNSSYKGYDYKTLGENCDRIVIMAYDYGPIPEPTYKVEQAVEMALKQVNAEKLILGISAPSETEDSIATKIGIAKRYNLKGIALWRLGLITQQMWTELRNSVQKE